MRFEELTFHRVGMWRDLAPLKLGPRLTIVLGDNEAGKSTSMRAIEALLFEPTKELIAPLASFSDFSASARVRLMDGTELGWRRQGRKVEPAEIIEKLEALAPPEQRSTFRDLFRLGHDQVRAHESFLSDEGALGRVLFAAESGASAARLNETEKSLRDREKAAESSATKGNGLKKIVGEYKALKEKQDERAGFGDYDRTDADLHAVEDEIKALRTSLKQARDEQKKLEAWKEGLPHARARQEAIEQLALLSEAGQLASREQAQAIREARARLEEAIGEQRQREQRLEEAAREVRVLPPVPPVAGFAAEVAELDRQVAGIEKDRESVEEARGSLAEAKRKLRELLLTAFDLNVDEGSVLAQARQLLVSPATRRAFKELLEDGEQAQGELVTARRAMDEAQRRSQQAREEAEASTELPTTALSEALALVPPLSSLDENLERLVGLRNDAEGRARVLKRTLGLTTLDEASISNLTLPSRQRLDEAFARLESARQAVRSATTKLDDMRTALQAASEEERSIREALQAAVTDAAFEAARRDRDQAWQQVKATWAPEWKDSARFDLPALGAVFERHLIEVDGLADRRFQNANQLGRLTKATEVHEAARRDLERADARLAEANTELSHAQADWNAHWSFLPHAPDSHADWLNGFKQLVENLDAADRAAKDHALTLEKRRAIRGDMANRLGSELPAAAPLDTAAALQSALQEELKRRKAHNDDATRKRNEHETQERNAREAAVRHDEKRQEVARWSDRWSKEIAALPSNVQGEVTTVRLWLDQQDALSQLCREHERLDELIGRKTTGVEAFEASVRALLDRVRTEDPALAVPASLSPLASLGELSRLASEARAAKELRRQKETALAHATREAADAQTSVDRRRDELSARWSEGGFQGEWTPERIETETTRADEAQAHREQIQQREATLRPLWKAELDVVLAAIDGRSEEELAGDARREGERIAALDDQLEACLTRKTKLVQAQEAFATEGAVEAAQNLALVADRLTEKANELVTLKAALWLLGKAREKATAGAAPLIDLASENFAQLTGGEYARLEIERDATPTLRAIPTQGDSRKANELSDGTLDQLWLALRLAVVQQAARNTPWPLVLDDVFVHFDDQRTTHALKLLARLSEQVQVIVFTHHDHVVDLARQAIPAELEVVVLARAEHRERLLPEERERHERPEAPAAHLPAKSGSGSAEDTEGYVLRVLESAAAPMGKAEILEAIERAFGVSIEREWNKAISALASEGRVVKEGEKRGAKYSLPSTDEATGTG